jgi:4-alpha-glucanotransferase
VAPRISLALTFHNHQPVGNFGWVFAEVYDTAYLPMLEALERHPGVRVGLHYTGPLLEWLAAERPDFVERLRTLVAHGQVELLGGGMFEPVLASLPERDRVAQLVRMADELERLTGIRPTGAWLAERVWEPDLPTALVRAGYRYTIVDDNHFRAAAIPEDALWGAYTTEDQGEILRVFGTEQGLRYRIPFGDVDDIIAFLRAHATEEGDRVGVMGDDGEKFGSWPTTWEHCWGSTQWVERFFTALEANADWLTTITPGGWLAERAPIGRVYLPTASYAEMGEWVLPANESLVFAGLLHRAQAENLPEARYLRGGFWRNFQVKYREINDLHKQMLRVSLKVEKMPNGRGKAVAMDHLMRGQSNDCYWHGLFGGIYIGHMRLATHEHLILAEDIADREPRSWGGKVDRGTLTDTDMDGIDEVLFTAPGQVVVVKPNEGGGIGSWDIRAVAHALTSVMRRRPEAYHETLVEHERSLAAAAERSGDAEGGEAGVGSIHDRVSTKEPGLADRLHYDAYERRSGLVHVLPAGTTADAFLDAGFDELGDLVDAAYAVEELTDDRVRLVRDGTIRSGGVRIPVRVTKTIVVGGDRAEPTLEGSVTLANRSGVEIDAVLALEWATTMLGGGGNPAAYYDVDGVRTAHDVTGSAQEGSVIRSGNSYIGIEVTSRPEPPAPAFWGPIETVSNSEGGFERVYQGSALVFTWPLRLAPGASETFHVRNAVTTTRDRAAEEGL